MGLGPLSDVFRHESYSPLKQIGDGQVYAASPGWGEGKEERGSVALFILFPHHPFVLSVPVFLCEATLAHTQVSLDDDQWHMG